MSNSKKNLLKVICGVCAAVMVFACAVGCSSNEEKPEDKAETSVTEQKKDDKANDVKDAKDKKNEKADEKKDDKKDDKKNEKADNKKDEKTDDKKDDKKDDKAETAEPEKPEPIEPTPDDVEVIILPDDVPEVAPGEMAVLPVQEEEAVSNESKIVAKAKKALNVPDKSSISYTVSQPMPSTTTGKDVVYVTFTENGNPVASAECDAATGDVVGGKMMYRG